MLFISHDINFEAHAEATRCDTQGIITPCNMSASIDL